MSLSRLVGVAAVVACAGMALATVTKIKAFSPAGAGTALNPNVDGMAIFREGTDPVNGTGMRLHLHMEALEAYMTYGVAIYLTGDNPEDGADFSNALAFTTNASGNGTFEWFLPAIDNASLGAAPRIQVYIWDGDPNPDSVAFVTPTELRADGTGG